MLNTLHAIIYGLVEGFTEFLPISSTAHLILLSKLLAIEQSDFIKTFEIAIQLGAILSVVVLYWKKFFNLAIIKRLIVAFIPTGIIGLVLYKLIKQFFDHTGLILAALLIGGLILILFEKFYRINTEEQSIEDMSYKQSFIVGVFQSIAMIPGVSRSAATIIGGMGIGISKKAIVEFSFLLAVPTMLAATVLDVAKNYQTMNTDHISFLLVGFVVSFIVAMVSIKFLLSYIKRRSFSAFGWYRIVIAILFLLFVK